MRLIVDAHALLWFLGDTRLSAEAREAIGEGANDVWVSAATIWEIAIKRARGRLESPADLRGRISADGMSEMAVRGDHAIAAAELPLIHGDPFDRMLVAQAQIEGLTIVTRDAEIARYRVPVLAA